MFIVPVTRFPRDLSRSPALDVAESDLAYTVRLDVPGVKKEDVKVTIDGRRVSVKAESATATDKKDDGDRIVYRERSVSSYARSFTLPVEVDQGSASAKLVDGVLALELPKRGATAAAQLTVN